MPILVKIPPLRPSMMFTDKNGGLTKDGYDFLFGVIQRVGGTLSNLDSASMLGYNWASPGSLGTIQPNSGKFSTLNVTSGVANNGGGFKHKRVPANIPANASGLVTATWTSQFPDTNYTVMVTVQDYTAANASAVVVHVENLTATSVVVRVNNTAATAFTGTVHLVAIHD